MLLGWGTEGGREGEQGTQRPAERPLLATCWDPGAGNDGGDLKEFIDSLDKDTLSDERDISGAIFSSFDSLRIPPLWDVGGRAVVVFASAET